MAIESTLPAFVAALKTQLEARSGLNGVVIATGPIPDLRDSIELLGAEDTTDWAMLGNRRIEEEFILSGAIYGYQTGGGEAAITAARSAVFAIFNELLSQLQSDPTVSGTVRLARVAGFTLDQGYGSEQRVAKIDFRITAQAYLTA